MRERVIIDFETTGLSPNLGEQTREKSGLCASPHPKMAVPRTITHP